MSKLLIVRLVAVLAAGALCVAPLGAQLPDRAFFAPVLDDTEYLLGVSVPRSRDRLFAARDLSVWLGDPLFFSRDGIDALRTLVVPGRFGDLPVWDAMYLDGRFDLSAAAGLAPYAALGLSASHVAYRPLALRGGGRSADVYLALAVGSVAVLVDLSVYEPREDVSPVVAETLFERVPDDAIVWASVRPGRPFYRWLLRWSGRLYPSPDLEPSHLGAFLAPATSVVGWVSEREPDTLRVLMRYPGVADAEAGAALLRFLFFPLAATHPDFPLFDITRDRADVLLSFVSVDALADWLRPLPPAG